MSCQCFLRQDRQSKRQFQERLDRLYKRNGLRRKPERQGPSNEETDVEHKQFVEGFEAEEKLLVKAFWLTHPVELADVRLTGATA